MIRLSGYAVVIAAYFAGWLTGDRYLWILLAVLFFAFPLACILDFVLRRRVETPGFIAWLMRISGFLAWLPAVVVRLVMWAQMPVAVWRQGPDTSYSRDHLGERFKSFREVYYLEEPTFVGAGDRYLRFSYNQGTELPRLLTSRGDEVQIIEGGCDAGRVSPPEWWHPSSTNGLVYRWHSARLCIDEAAHRAFLFWEGH